MAIYVNGITVAQSGAAVGGIEQVAVLPAVGAIDHLYFLTVADATHEVGLYYFDGTVWHSTGSGGGGSGTDDYNDLNNKPSINGVTLQGNKSLVQLNIASIDTTYTRTKVDELISASQKVYLQATPPTYLSNVGLYYVGAAGSTNYDIYLVDSTKQVTNLGSAGISLTGYQKEVDPRLYWTPTSTVVDSINDLKYRLDNLPSGGTITMNGMVTGSPTFYAPTTSGTFGQKLISYGPNQPPQWVNETGESGTKVMLNGGTTAVAEAHIYVPSLSGTPGDVLKSQGPGMPPIWVTPGAEAGPTMTLNGTVKDVTSTDVKIYAPITSGDDGFILKSKGPGLAPQWVAPGESDGAYMTLNGGGVAVTLDTCKIYAPITAGTAGQTLKSTGTGAPVWSDGGSGEMTVNDEVKEVSADLKIYTPKDSGTKAKMLVGNEATNVPTWETSCRSVTLTKAEYDDLSTTKKNDPNIIYYITDDVSGTTEDPNVRWSESLKSKLTSATDDQFYTAKAMNDILSSALDAFFDQVYPIGTYIVASMKPTRGTWTEVTDSTGRALWLNSGQTWGTTIAQGLPNITGKAGSNIVAHGASSLGALTFTKNGSGDVAGGSGFQYGDISFDASKSNSIYGSSTKVQPNAYCIRM